MSEIRVNRIANADGTAAPTMTYGFQVPTGMGITGAGGINISGVCTAGIVTATSLYGTLQGNAQGLTGTPNISCGTGAFSGAVNVDDTTDSTSATSGSLIVDGGLGVAKNVYIGAGLSVAGTLTYEDVTNVDSVGLITAKSGVNVSGGQLVVGAGFSVGAAGVGTFAGNLVVNGNIDLEGDIDVNGTMEADAITVNGSTLASVIEGTTVTNSTHILVTDNESTNEDNLITFVEGATSSTGQVGLEMDGNLTYNPSTGRLTATQLAGTLQTAAQTNITSVGTLAGLTVGSAGEFKVGTGVTIASTSGVTTFSENVSFLSDNGANFSFDAANSTFNALDSAYIKCGSSGDLLFFHDGSNSYIRNITGYLDIQPKSGEAGIRLNPDGAISIAYDGNFKLATTNDGTVTTGIGTFTAGANFDGILSEKFHTTAGKFSDNDNIDLENGMIHFFTTQETTTTGPNIRYNSSKTLNSMLTTGDSLTVTVVTTAAAAGYAANWRVDGANLTEEWNGGEAPSEGGSGGYDVYTITLLKTGNDAYTCLANVSNFA